MDLLKAEVTLGEPDIIALTETWLDANILELELEIPSYRLFRRDRSRHGGGIALYINESLVVSSHKTSEAIKFMAVWISLRGGTLLLGLHYRPPGTDSSLEELESVLSKLQWASYGTSLLLGDFNIDLLQGYSSTSLDLKGLTSSFGLTQLVTEATRVTDTSSTLIDHAYTSNPSVCSGVSVEAPLGSSDHNSIVVHLSYAKCKPKSVKRRIWLYQRADFEGLNDYLMDSLTDTPLNVDVNDQWNNFKNSLLAGANEFIPNFHTNRRKPVTNLPKSICNLISRRNRLHTLAKKTDSTALWSRFRVVRNKVVSAVRNCKKKFPKSPL